jgi:FOG: WD40 repeat
MRKQKPQQTQNASESASRPENSSGEQQDNKKGNFDEVEGSPIPGLTLRHVLRGHTGTICRLAWSRDGTYLASPSTDKTIRIWNAQSEVSEFTLEGKADVFAVAWSPDGKHLASGSNDGTVRIWKVSRKTPLRVLRGHDNFVASVAWSPDGELLASASGDRSIRLWDAASGECLRILEGHKNWAECVAWSPDGRRLASISGDKTIRLWNPTTGKELKTIQAHKNYAISVAWSPDGQCLASSSEDQTIRVWDATDGKPLVVLEGHVDRVAGLSFSNDGDWLASKSDKDNTVRLWRCDTWECVAVLDEAASTSNWFQSLAFHPRQPRLATLGDHSTSIRIWDLDRAILLGQAYGSVNYTTAKVVLVGDSGVGKTGLGWRLSHGEFKEHASTHGQQFWVVPQLSGKRTDGTECEAVLWDLAGQPVYGHVHPLFLDNVDTALVLFDPSNRQEPLKGTLFWLEHLKGNSELPPTVLVGARVDRGGPTLSQQELDQFCQRHNISGGYMSTSAYTGEGLEALLDKLKTQIPWDEMTATVTTVTFKHIKDYVLTLKERPDREEVLVSPLVLREQLKATDPEWQFTDAEMMTAVKHLETHGYVAVLRSSANEQHILLTPDLLATLASSMVLLADKHPRELGAVNETELLQGKVPFDELAGLSPAESQILLDAAILRFLEHNICFRETLGNETLLIFPSLIKQRRPLQDDLPATENISYVVRGRVKNLFASLVVLLGYTPSFTRINQWHNQAQYEMEEGQICGFRLIEDREGEIELVLYYGDQMPTSGRLKFQELFEQFLYQRDVNVTRFPAIVCTNGHQQQRATVIDRVRERKPFMFCDECGNKITLPDFDKPQHIGIGASPWLQLEEAAAHLRSAYEVQLTKVKSYRRDWAVPRCYISYVDEQSEWAKGLIKDLREAGVYVVEQLAQVQLNDFVVVLDTAAYQKVFKSKGSDLAADIALIKARLNKNQVISLALAGPAEAHEFEKCQPGSFSDETHYPVSLFDLVLNLYAIPLPQAGFFPLRQLLHDQWEQTLAGTEKQNATSAALKLFISYSHKDERFKTELLTMLAGLQQQNVIDVWQDRRIEEGDEWYQAIQNAMNECEMAILLISPEFIASRFIQDEELPQLLQRRRENGLRVVPIIVRPCKWTSEPSLKNLQALPTDGKAVIRFTKANGAREQVWTDIATAIEKRAKAKTRSTQTESLRLERFGF